MKTFRLIRSPVMPAAANMEFDAAMLARYLQDGVPAFRVYGWSSPSFTYGISQDPQTLIDLRKCIEDGIGLAGRMTGGGVLFHDDEVTYSFVCGKEDVAESASHLVAYREICAFLISFYRSLGLDASFAVESSDFAARSAPSGLCAASHEKYDIVINGKKIGGNAQKRRRQAIFQHGSIPRSIDRGTMLRYLKNAPEGAASGVTSLSEEMGIAPDKYEIEDGLITAFGSTFGLGMIEEGAGSNETAMAR